MKQRSIGILVSGGPAPGINSVISSCVIEAENSGFQAIGIEDGFEGPTLRGDAALVKLSTAMVSSLHTTGGSILRTSRFNPLREESTKNSFIKVLTDRGIDKLIVIGGDGSAFLSHLLCIEFPQLNVVHVPKTIDNDLILPNQHPSFGFETARFAGTEILNTLIVDAKTCSRWFVVTTMGRKAGFLALGLGLAAGSTLTIIPEEFEPCSIKVDQLAQIVMTSVKKRLAAGKSYGLALIAEGVLDCLDLEGEESAGEITRDELGRINYSQFELSDLLGQHLRPYCKDEAADVRFITKNIGYELRCHPPVSFDIEYTRFLGYGAVRFLLEGKRDVMVTKNFDTLGHVPLSEMIRADGTIKSRRVNLNSDFYKVARSFMIR